MIEPEKKQEVSQPPVPPPPAEEKPPVEPTFARKFSNCMWGVPGALLVLAAIICLVLDIYFIAMQVKDTSLSVEWEPWSI